MALKSLKIDLEANKASIALGVCQGSDIEALDPLIKVLNDAITSFSSMEVSSREAVKMLECEPINDLYVDFYRDGVCSNLPSSVSWMFATMSCIVFFGMGIFLLRGALLPSIDPSHPKDKDSNYYDKRSDENPATKTSSSEKKKKATKRNKQKEVSASRANVDLSSSDEEDNSMLLSVASTTKSNAKKKPTKKVVPIENSSDEEWQSDSSSDSSQGYNQKYRRRAK